MAALLQAAKAPAYPAEIALVLSNRPDARGLDHARDAGVCTAIVDHRGSSKADFEHALDRALREARIELVCLAGFMRLLSSGFVDSWRDRLINIHPSLLPAFPGLETHERVLAAGVKIHGATVHFVRAAMDQGPIVAQGALAVRPEDTPETLAARVLRIEHRIYPLALKLVAGGAATVAGERVEIAGSPSEEALLLSPPEATPAFPPE
jgi:phosphoribosylglycinamide formyltransferase-1